MKRTPIEGSSNLLSMGYDFDNLTLEIEFKGNRVYSYHPVSSYMWDKLLEAESKGTYFAGRIRNNKGIICTPVDEMQAH